MPSMNDVLGLILGGGAGKRLYPLTSQRSKPAVPIAGKYRLIDIPISNCINSNITKIAILTQYNSVSLHRHISTTYNFDHFHDGYVQILAAEQTPSSTSWYQGTADAVRKQLFEIHATRTDYVLILAGDHLYRMDYEAMARYHWENEADITVGVQPVSGQEAYRFGILKRSPDGRLTDFIEKPQDPELLAKYRSRDDEEKPYLGSMGIYLFNLQVLDEVLDNLQHDDFGSDIIPAAIQSKRVFGYDFDGYWEDIGTIRSFYETNLSLARPDSPFDLYDPEHVIYTHARFLPGSVIDGATLTNVLIAEGCTVGRAEIEESIVGLRSQIRDGVKIKRTILMGADYYDPPSGPIRGGVPLGIGENCQIEGAIIDKNARLGPGVIIRPFPEGTEMDREDYSIRDGIVVIPKSRVIQGGTVIGPAG
ncbi:MAG: glucose-1-phosphate adenylyltransferase [Chloroflexi bacterium]|nr:MAG: glucose-1-phosphate adenylyltransferase [Chloroflexota bacterium]